ncbi:uncharacterized protein G2W53_030875 [Senna tora]|uniref:Uncharacterized protein n=1 Tax=Senna tora TaxID=362788 RepID=A0A834WEZ9_9FABA|nr:uncharacterized protein G2W53_030875 [Senna tora]
MRRKRERFERPRSELMIRKRCVFRAEGRNWKRAERNKEGVIVEDENGVIVSE